MDWNAFFLALIGLMTAISTVLNQIAARNAAKAQQEARQQREEEAIKTDQSRRAAVEVKDTLRAVTDSTNQQLSQLHQGQEYIKDKQQDITDTGNKIHTLVNSATSLLLKDKVKLALENLEKAKLIIQLSKSAGCSEDSLKQANISLESADKIYRSSVEASDKHEAKQRKVDEM